MNIFYFHLEEVWKFSDVKSVVTSSLLLLSNILIDDQRSQVLFLWESILDHCCSSLSEYFFHISHWALIQLSLKPVLWKRRSNFWTWFLVSRRLLPDQGFVFFLTMHDLGHVTVCYDKFISLVTATVGMYIIIIIIITIGCNDLRTYVFMMIYVLQCN